jgi:hypothetical protein
MFWKILFKGKAKNITFENWGCRLFARRPGDLSQCHSEEPFDQAQDKLRDEESACYLFSRGSKK